MKTLFLDTDARRALTALFSAAYPAERTESMTALLLEKYGSLARILQVNQSILEGDIGADAALYLRLSLSLSLRATTDRLKSGDTVTRAVLARHFGALYADAGQETVYVVLMDERDRLIAVQCAAVGSVDASGLQPRQVLESAVRMGAKSVILAHNHPGGTLKPSASDKKITEALASALEAARIRFLGHYIFAGSGFIRIGEEENGDKTPSLSNFANKK